MTDTPAGLEEITAHHWRELNRMLVAITRDAATADDLTQEVFVVALRKGMVPGPQTRLWLREVARRLAVAELRRRRPLARADFEAFLSSIEPPERTPPRAEFADELAALRACVEQLPPGLREFVSLRYEKEEPLKTLAAKARRTVGYMKQIMFRLRKRLAECIRRRTDTGVARG